MHARLCIYYFPKNSFSNFNNILCNYHSSAFINKVTDSSIIIFILNYSNIIRKFFNISWLHWKIYTRYFALHVTITLWESRTVLLENYSRNLIPHLYGRNDYLRKKFPVEKFRIAPSIYFSTWSRPMVFLPDHTLHTKT